MVLQRIVRSNSRNKLTATLFHNIAYYSFISNKQGGGRLLIFQQFATQDGPYSIPPCY